MAVGGLKLRLALECSLILPAPPEKWKTTTVSHNIEKRSFLSTRPFSCATGRRPFYRVIFSLHVFALSCNNNKFFFFRICPVFPVLLCL